MPIPWGPIASIAGGLLGLGRTHPPAPISGGDNIYAPSVVFGQGGGGPGLSLDFSPAGDRLEVEGANNLLPYYPISPLPVPDGWSYDYDSYAGSVTDISRAAVERPSSGLPWVWVAAGLGGGLLIMLLKKGKK